MENYDLHVKRGETFQQTVYYRTDSGEVILLDGKAGRCQIRSAPEQGNLIAEAEVRILPQEGRVTLFIPADVTAGFDPGCYVYDFCLITSETGDIRFDLGGTFTVYPSVTETEAA